ncbi:hypothetical protein HPB52_022856 [Rhipicephalus sanguineus]|uniref:Transmembrane protein n=1 Tax=Rhipicephalus sanguineus TaxID=34632 RepID=A0A9D4YQW6_RHISA|nr:hypothetical protein HPB52_022856 [Rhipicephalus sanguineus]
MERTQRGAEERRSAGLIESHDATRNVGSSAQADSGTPASPDEEPEKDERGRNTNDGGESSTSAETSRSRLLMSSPDCEVAVESNVDGTSSCRSEDATPVTSLRASGGIGRRLSPTSLAARRRHGLRTFWRMHKNALLIAFFFVFVIGCLTATAMGGRSRVEHSEPETKLRTVSP